MNNRNLLSPDARFRMLFNWTELAADLEGFVAFVGRLIEQGHDLEYSVPQGFSAYPAAESRFSYSEGRINETFALRDEALYDEWRPTYIEYAAGNGALRARLSSTPWNALNAIGTILNGDFAAIEPRSSAQALLESMRSVGVFDPSPSSLQIDFSADGIYRLQHASLLIRYHGVGILVDPHLHSAFSPGFDADITLSMVKPFVDAIAISHPHEDHFSLSTLLMFDRATPIIVPPAERDSIISCDMRQLLERVGFRNVHALEWWSTGFDVGEIRVFALPFYGEQPLLEHPMQNDALRNAGSTYLFSYGGHTAWILIDSGCELRGTMPEVAQRVFEDFGSVDLVLSNLSEFTIFGPNYINGGLNWLTLSPEDKLRLPAMRHHLLTLGPHGAAEVCHNARAKRYAPYAHWWGPVPALGGVASGASDQEQVESRGVAMLRDCLHRLGAKTSVVDWYVGDRLDP